MKKCKLIINNMSGNSASLPPKKELEQVLKTSYDAIDTAFIEKDSNLKMSDEMVGYDALAVCGGDGTLNSALNAIKGTDAELVYVPCGTLNDAGKCLKLAKELGGTEKKIRRIDIGQVNDTMFAYVCAGGTFTPIGYTASVTTKKKVKVLAYISMVIKEYKIHRMKATIELNNRKIEGEYTLIMVINSSRCFGFSFNKMYRHNDGKAQLLLIRSPKSNGFWGKIAIFFPFFRAFFIGFKKEADGKMLKFLTVDNLKLTLDEGQDFTVDGEKIHLDKVNTVKIHKQKLKMVVL